jgi:hypothetical protein
MIGGEFIGMDSPHSPSHSPRSPLYSSRSPSYPSGARSGDVTEKVVIWSENDKRIETCTINLDSTFHHVIDLFETQEMVIQSELLGDNCRPFELMSVDFETV